MAAIAIAYRGSLTAIITNVCLRATSIVGIAHSLPTAPEIGAITRLLDKGNTTLGDGIGLTYDATTITFTNRSGCDGIVCDAWVQCLHSVDR